MAPVTGMRFDLHALTATADIRDLPDWQARLVAAFRCFALASRRRQDVSERLAALLGGEAKLRPFRVFVDEITGCWPDAFALHPPCRLPLSHDESLMLDLASAAVRGDRVAFGLLLVDMLPASAIAALWTVTGRLVRAVAPAG